MLLAAVSLVLHGVAPAMAKAVTLTAGTLHARGAGDCHGSQADLGQETSHSHRDGGALAAEADAASPGADRQQRPGRPLDCCAALTAAVLPATTEASLPMPPVSRGVAPREGVVPEGVRPEHPPEPPRTSDQG